MSTPPLEQSLLERFEPLRRALASGPLAQRVADARVVVLPGSEPPWTDTGVALEPGDEITVLADGRIVFSEELDLWFGPRVYLWRRIGEGGPVFRAARETATHRANCAGTLQLGIYPGAWSTRNGEHVGTGGLGGALGALLIRWRGDGAEGVRALAAACPEDALVRAELERLEHPAIRPAHWEPLWYLGETDLFTAAERDGRPVIRARPENEAAIIKRAVDTELTPETRLTWSWRVEELPSKVAENTLPTHDYISIAVEFDNGQDLTWYWSAALPEETVFRCPLPWWDQRETHIAIRSGTAALGRWSTETRDLYADYERALGKPPERIVGVWLIAVSFFTHGRGAADFADIALEQPGRRIALD